MAKVFISHSGRSSNLAKAFSSWIPSIISSRVDCFCSANEDALSFGPELNKRIVENATKAKVCLSILDHENYLRPWMLFEPGVFYGQKKVVIFLACGNLRHSHLQKQGYPIEGYGASPDEAGIRKLFHDIALITLSRAAFIRLKPNLPSRIDPVINEYLSKYREVYPGGHAYDEILDEIDLFDKTSKI